MEETRELLAGARRGAPGSLQRLVVKYGEDLMRHVRLSMTDALRDEADSQDLVQELFVDLVRDYEEGHVPTEADFLRWARGVARNNARDLARRASVRRRARIDLDDSHRGPAAASENLPARILERAEDAGSLRAALETLSPEEFASIELREIRQLPWDEVARRTGRPSAHAARSFHARTLAKLATRLTRRTRGKG